MENQRRIENRILKPQIVADKCIERGLFGRPEYFLTCVGSDGTKESIKVDSGAYRCTDVLSEVYIASFGEDPRLVRGLPLNLNNNGRSALLN